MRAGAPLIRSKIIIHSFFGIRPDRTIFIRRLFIYCKNLASLELIRFVVFLLAYFLICNEVLRMLI